jgi:hypothetical protein
LGVLATPVLAKGISGSFIFVSAFAFYLGLLSGRGMPEGFFFSSPVFYFLGGSFLAAEVGYEAFADMPIRLSDLVDFILLCGFAPTLPPPTECYADDLDLAVFS